MITQSLDQMLAYIKAGEPELTTRQLALLLIVHSQSGPHTVRGLAKQLGVQKPVVTRALNTLGGMAFTMRQRDEHDRRNVLITPLPAGSAFVRRHFDESLAVAA